MNPIHIPNILTLFRFVLLGPILYAGLNESFKLALYLFVVAGFTDGLDGFLARRYGWTTRLGSALDPVADKVMLVSCFVMMYTLGMCPDWLLGVIIVRDIIIISGALFYHFYVGQYQFYASWVSKLNTFMQIVLLFMMFLNLAYPGLVPDLFVWMTMAIVTFASVTSCMGYAWVWTLRGWAELQARR